MIKKVSISLIALAVVGAVAVVAVWWFVWRTLEVYYALDNSANESIISETIAEIELLNPTLRFIEADGQPDLTFEFANLANGTEARFQNANVSINATHIGCRNQTTDYTRNVLLNHTNTGIQQYLATATMREIAFPPVHSTANNALVGEAQMRSQIATLQRDITLSDNALDRYDINNVSFATWGAYSRVANSRNNSVGEYSGAIENLTCLLNISNSFETYEIEPVANAIIRYSVNDEGISALEHGRNDLLIIDVVNFYQMANSNFTFEQVAVGTPNEDLIFSFANLTNGTPARRQGSNEVVINNRHNACDSRTSNYTGQALFNHSIEAIAQYISFHSAIPFTQPALINTSTNLIVDEMAKRESIASLRSDVDAGDDFIDQYRLVDRIPIDDFTEYRREVISRNEAAEEYNEASADLECLLNVSATTFREFSLVEPKRRVGQFNYAIDPGEVNSPFYRRAVETSVRRWEFFNPELSFFEVDHDALDLDFLIDYHDIPDDEDFAGWYCPTNGCHSRNAEVGRPSTNLPAANYAEVVVDIGGLSCENEFLRFTNLYIQDITMHEIGHVLGLGHSTDREHLLYGTRPPPMANFDDLGYRIPGVPGWETRYHRADDINVAIDRIGSRIDAIDARMDDIDTALESITIRFDGNTRIVSDLSRANRLVAEWNDLNNERNNLIDDHNEHIDEWDCIFNR